jgi:excisionase family DNA binding protein
VNVLDQAFEAMIKRVVREVFREELAAMRAAPAAGGLVTVAEFARRHSISVSKVRGDIREGHLAATKIGRCVRIAADAQIGKSPMLSEASPSMRAVRILRGRP